MALYKPGDRVLVRPDLERHKWYPMEDDNGSNNVNAEMSRFAGLVCTIRYISPNGQYHLKEDPRWYWTDGMFVGLADECEDFDIPDGCSSLF